MAAKKVIIMMLAVSMTVGYFNTGRAEEAMPAPKEPDGGAVAGAVVSDLIYVPGKAGTCVLSGALWTVAMVITGGTYYKEAGNFVHEACTGKWVVRGADMMDEKECNR